LPARRKVAEKQINKYRIVMSSWKMAMDVRYTKTIGQRQEMNVKLNQIQAFCKRLDTKKEKPNGSVIGEMVEILCEKICSIFETMQNEIDSEKEINITSQWKLFAGKFRRPKILLIWKLRKVNFKGPESKNKWTEP
jgi:hypothetical protein